SFSPGWGILAILGWGQLVNLGVGSAGVLLSMTGHSRVEFYNAAAMVGVNVALNLALIPVYGGAGAALATGVSLAGINLLRLIEVGAILGVVPFSSRYAGTVLCALAAAVGAGVYRACFTELPSPGAALVAVAVFAAVYLLLGSRILLDDRSLAGFNNQLRRLLGRR
ncbi:MAG TPA: polysaccharide biosynthesis C-terminal domain-containing protein, partial [bacterium]|nr:polysaccharide biosynthesis C-terminal domain-containing protein [bacterium]